MAVAAGRVVDDAERANVPIRLVDSYDDASANVGVHLDAHVDVHVDVHAAIAVRGACVR